MSVQENEKKKIIIIILVIFPAAGNNWKIIIIIIKTKKKNFAEKNGIWLLPKLFCNTTIALQAAGQARRRVRRALGAQGKRALGARRAGAGHWVSGRRALGRVTRSVLVLSRDFPR